MAVRQGVIHCSRLEEVVLRVDDFPAVCFRPLGYGSGSQFLPSGRGRMFTVQTDEESLCCGLLCHAPIGLVAWRDLNPRPEALPTELQAIALTPCLS